MWKANQSRELYKCTLQQKAIQDILKAFSIPAETLDLGERAKLNQRGTNLLLDLIKATDFRILKFGDCILQQSELRQIRRFLQDEVEDLEFCKNVNLGVEGTLLLKSILKRKPASTVAFVECDLNAIQLKNVIESLLDMKWTSMEELDLSGNSIGNEGVNLITQLVWKKHLKKLRLMKCYITANHLKLLSEGINKMKGTMDSIDLRKNFISKKDTEYFRKTVENKIIEVTFY